MLIGQFLVQSSSKMLLAEDESRYRDPESNIRQRESLNWRSPSIRPLPLEIGELHRSWGKKKH